MKKIYSQPELNLLVLTEDIVSTSGYTFAGFSGGDLTENWWQD